jgi:hypothetical protein
MEKTTFPLSQVYRLLEPGPVVMVTTARKGRTNIMTMSWHTMMEFAPPIVGCVISNRNYSFEILKATRECVINIPTVELAEKVVDCGNASGQRVDKFKAFGLTPVAAACVKAPLIAECHANLECKVIVGSWSPNTTSLSLRSSKRGLTHRGNIRGRFITRGKVYSWLLAGRSSCLPQSLPASQSEAPASRD